MPSYIHVRVSCMIHFFTGSYLKEDTAHSRDILYITLYFVSLHFLHSFQAHSNGKTLSPSLGKYSSPFGSPAYSPLKPLTNFTNKCLTSPECATILVCLQTWAWAMENLTNWNVNRTELQWYLIDTITLDTFFSKICFFPNAFFTQLIQFSDDTNYFLVPAKILTRFHCTLRGNTCAKAPPL